MATPKKTTGKKVLTATTKKADQTVANNPKPKEETMSTTKKEAQTVANNPKPFDPESYILANASTMTRREMADELTKIDPEGRTWHYRGGNGMPGVNQIIMQMKADVRKKVLNNELDSEEADEIISKHLCTPGRGRGRASTQHRRALIDALVSNYRQSKSNS